MRSIASEYSFTASGTGGPPSLSAQRHFWRQSQQQHGRRLSGLGTWNRISILPHAQDTVEDGAAPSAALAQPPERTAAQRGGLAGGQSGDDDGAKCCVSTAARRHCRDGAAPPAFIVLGVTAGQGWLGGSCRAACMLLLAAADRDRGRLAGAGHFYQRYIII